jgi:protein-tyrosine phosphatase
MVEKVRILFVCMGNICRSPTAQGVFTSLLQAEGLSEFFEIDSAGTHAYHEGEPPDPRAGYAARKRGIDLGDQRARRIHEDDFEYFDYVVAMDRSNFEDLAGSCAPQHQSKVRLFLDFASELPEIEIPDPYYGGPQGFERVLDLIEHASRAMISELRKQHRLTA